MTQEELYNLSDEELEQALKEQEVKEEVQEVEEPLEVEQSLEGIPEEEDAHTSPKTYKIKANGMEFDFTLDELISTASKGMDYTKKMQAIKPYRTTINTIKEHGISDEDLNLLIDIKKGNKQALSALVKNSGADIYDLDDESEYIPNNYKKSEAEVALQEAVGEISQDDAFSETKEVLNSLDNKSLEFIYSDSRNLLGLHSDIKDGTYQKVMPRAMKLAMMDGYQKPVIEYYLSAGNDYFKEANEKALREEQKKQNTTKAKQQASLPKSRVDTKVKDYLNDDDMDEAYEKWYQSVISKY